MAAVASVETPASGDFSLSAMASSSGCSSSSDSGSSSGESSSASSTGRRKDRRQEKFGPFTLRHVFEQDVFVGVRIQRARHVDTDPSCASCGTTNPCMRGIQFGSKAPLTEAEASLRCKRWACFGYTIDATDPRGRHRHHAKAPRSFSRPLDPSVKALPPAHLFHDGALDDI